MQEEHYQSFSKLAKIFEMNNQISIEKMFNIGSKNEASENEGI